MVIQMIPGTYRQTPYGAPLFGRYDGRPFYVGTRMETIKAAERESEASLFPLSVKRDKGRLHHWPKTEARKMWGFHELSNEAA